ncbi:alpha/beta fold hydrolase [Nonomuraea sp. NPDC048881]|uniref:alpha/beta fold hydrolase n=1 Tax=Nonomuraea sp. NPDC048881 TaxID=3155030 RepID=UPI0033C35D5D
MGEEHAPARRDHGLRQGAVRHPRAVPGPFGRRPRPPRPPEQLRGRPAEGRPAAKWVKPELLPRIQVPTLLIHGRDDRVVSFETSLYLLASIPDSRLVLLNRCGHWAMIEHADEFNRLVADFIANN